MLGIIWGWQVSAGAGMYSFIGAVAVVVVPDHLGFVKGQVDLVTLYKLIAYQMKALAFQLFSPAEEVGIRRHIEQSLSEYNTPWVLFGVFVYQHWDLRINLFS